MTVNEAHIQFKLLSDKVDSLNSPNFLDEEIDVYLSDAQEQFIEQRAYGRTGETLEQTQKRVKDLQSITLNAVIPIGAIVTTADNKPNSIFVPLPNNYRHSIEEEVIFDYLDCHGVTQTSRAEVVALTHDKYNKTVRNPFSKPDNSLVYRLPYGRVNQTENFELVFPSTATNRTSYILRYLKNPTKIDKAQRLTPVGLAGTAQMDMTDEACREIVSLAVRNAMGDLTGSVESIRQKLSEIEK